MTLLHFGKRKAFAAVLVLFATCCTSREDASRAVVGGDPARGRLVILRESCGSCHEIPGISGADGLVGPPLSKFSRRTMIAGELANTPPNLEKWLMTPQAVVPGNAMPDMGLTAQQARDAAAYLYSIH